MEPVSRPTRSTDTPSWYRKPSEVGLTAPDPNDLLLANVLKIVVSHADNMVQFWLPVSDELTTSWRPPTEPDANLGYLFRLAHQRFRAALDNELDDLGLSAQEYVILSVFETRLEALELRARADHPGDEADHAHRCPQA